MKLRRNVAKMMAKFMAQNLQNMDITWPVQEQEQGQEQELRTITKHLPNLGHNFAQNMFNNQTQGENRIAKFVAKSMTQSRGKILYKICQKMVNQPKLWLT
jgi:hypothetical protein